MSTCRQINTEIENKQKMTNLARLSSHVNILAYITETADAWPNLSGMDSFVIHPLQEEFLEQSRLKTISFCCTYHATNTEESLE